MKRLQSESGLNYLTDTLTSAWDAMRANFGVSQKSSAPHGWLTRHRWPLISLFSYLRAFSQILPLLPLYFHFQFQSGRSSPFLPLLLCFSPYSRPTARPFRAPGRRSTKRPYRCRRNNQLPIILDFHQNMQISGREGGNLYGSDRQRLRVSMRTRLTEGRCPRVWGGPAVVGATMAPTKEPPTMGAGTVETTSQTSVVVTNIKTLLVIIFITRRGRGTKVKRIVGFIGTSLLVTAIGANEDN